MTNEYKDEGIVDEVEDTVETTEDTTEDTIDWQAKAKEYEGRMKRAETKLSKTPKDTPAGKPSTSNGLDYGEKAFLVANGIKGETETKFVQQVMQETGKNLEQVLESKFFKAELEEMRELAKTAEATPSGKRSGSSTTDSVEYWMSKPIEEVPKEMRTQVVNAKIKRESSTGVFYNS